MFVGKLFNLALYLLGAIGFAHIAQLTPMGTQPATQFLFGFALLRWGIGIAHTELNQRGAHAIFGQGAGLLDFAFQVGAE